MGAGANAGPGSGGIGQGRGDAELQIGAPVDPFFADAFQSERLTPAEYAALDQSTLIGVGVAAPTASGSAGEAAGGAAPAATSAGSAAWKRRIDPRHRRAVSKFFER
ncbi:MAG: hypothetical protein ACJA2W_001373 [Planctomycetota bacterium]|jgi:hypothetical protein